MEKQLDTHTNYQDKHWLNIAETVAVVASIGGTVASILVKEIVIVSVPLSACVALNLINRKRLLALTATENNQAIASLSQQNQNDHGNISDQVMQVEQSVREKQYQNQVERDTISEELKQLNLNYKEQIGQLEAKYRELVSKTVPIAQNTTSTSAELYYQNADGYKQMGEIQKAIDDYSKAIKIDRLYAEAYVSRGILSAELGHKQVAVEDLRRAAKLYFDRGDLNNYQKTKQQTQEIYQLNSEHTVKQQDSEEASKAVLASSLFA